MSHMDNTWCVTPAVIVEWDQMKFTNRSILIFTSPRCSLVPRPLPAFRCFTLFRVKQQKAGRKKHETTKSWEWPGDEANLGDVRIELFFSSVVYPHSVALHYYIHELQRCPHSESSRWRVLSLRSCIHKKKSLWFDNKLHINCSLMACQRPALKLTALIAANCQGLLTIEFTTSSR